MLTAVSKSEDKGFGLPHSSQYLCVYFYLIDSFWNCGYMYIISILFIELVCLITTSQCCFFHSLMSLGGKEKVFLNTM